MKKHIIKAFNCIKKVILFIANIISCVWEFIRDDITTFIILGSIILVVLYIKKCLYFASISISVSDSLNYLVGTAFGVEATILGLIQANKVHHTMKYGNVNTDTTSNQNIVADPIDLKDNDESVLDNQKTQ